MRYLIVLAIVLAMPAVAQARTLDVANATEDPDFCLGIKLKDWEPYDGDCKYGTPLMPLQVVGGLVKPGTVNERLKPLEFPNPALRVNLVEELEKLHSLPAKKGKKRVRRNARRAQRSWASRASINCLFWGAFGAGLAAIAAFIAEGEVNGKQIAAGAVPGCVGAVATPKLNRFLKKRGFDMRE